MRVPPGGGRRRRRHPYSDRAQQLSAAAYDPVLDKIDREGQQGDSGPVDVAPVGRVLLVGLEGEDSDSAGRNA
jgi:hypothetical protein